MLERLLENNQFLAQIRASKTPKPGSRIKLADDSYIYVLEKKNDLYLLKPEADIEITQLLDKYGHMPLPPYIERSDEALDEERYQTVYAERPGSRCCTDSGFTF